MRFKDLPVYFDRPAATGPIDRAELGLPTTGTLYACLQSLFKFHPAFDPVLAEIVRADSTAKILMIGDAQDTWVKLLNARWANAFPEVAAHVVWLAPMTADKFLSVLAAADVAIDPFPFAGGNTTLQALGVGTPLVTLPTAFMRGRCGIAAYDQIGFMDLVARDPAHYVELAVRVANDAPYRSHCVDAIRAGHDRLFETQSVIDEFNDFFASAYEASFTEGSLA